jgi:DNA polymerase bacteriophage-type
MTVQWSIDNGPTQVADLHVRGDTFVDPPREYLEAAEAADEIWAHGAEFEQQLLAHARWWPLIEPSKWRCTMALARMHGLPGGLDKLSTIFKLGIEGKDERGRELIQLFCVPHGKKGVFNDKHSHPEQWADFITYARQDVPALQAVRRKCPKWNATPRMWAVWHLDQQMNERGVRVDLKLCEGTVKATTTAKKRLADWTEEATLGVVERTTQRDRLLAYMEEFGVTLPDLTADTVERRLEYESLPEHIKELLRVRQQASKASTAKYQRAINQHVGGRLRNLLVFCGASRTGRWAGRTLQPQNLPRPKHKPWEIEQAITAFQHDAMDLYDPEDCLGLASSALRGIIISEDDRKLCVADLANVEGRVMAWVAGEDWKLAAFAAYDRKEGPDLYKLAYARSFNIDPDGIADEGDQRRQIGKVQELALQYYGGVGAFCSMAETYGLRLDALAAAAWPVIPLRVKKQATEHWHRAIKRRRTYGLEERIWVVCESLVILWREAHPAIVQFWYDLEAAIPQALAGKTVQVRRVTLDRELNWLRIRLPSGRYLSYPAPRLGDDGSSFLGVCPYTKQWKRIGTYSGKLAENIVQASSADLLMDGMLAADAAGYNPVLSVHDEIITEPPDEARFNDKELSRLMVESSPWAAGLPLAAKGFTAKRYAKR